MNSIYSILDQSGYQPTIGLEVHVQLNTSTKIFSSDQNGSHHEPNRHIHMTSLGLPGTLPVLNRDAVRKAIQFALAVDSEINEKIYFDRKSYFYPDLPKGYQTTQDKAPVCKKGKVEAYSEEISGVFVDLHHVHLEEDAGKSVHDEGSDTLIDLNRAGSPLIEIVTEPCISSGEMAAAFLQEIRRIVRFLGISDANMEKGELRCDANISIRDRQVDQLGNKVEIKNMNSFNHVRKAIDYELSRQFGLIDKGQEVLVETRTFDPTKGRTHGMRLKETLNDYRYFPCPDLPPLYITKETVEELKQNMQMTPSQVRQAFVKHGLQNKDVASLSADLNVALFALRLIKDVEDAKLVANWVNGPIRAYLNEKEISIEKLPRSMEDFVGLLRLVQEGLVNSSSAMQILFPQFMATDDHPKDIALEEKLLIQSDEAKIEQLVQEVLLTLTTEVSRFKKGEKQLFGLFMGALMKNGGRQYNPKKLQEILRNELSK